MDPPTPPQTSAGSRAFSILLVLLVAVSVFVRFTKLDLMEYKRDELRFHAEAIRNAVDFGSVNATWGATMIPHPPGFIYLMTIPAALSDDPRTTDPVDLVIVVALVNLIGLALLYGFLRDMYSKEIALWGTALMASVPWAIIFSRKIWIADIVFPIGIAFIWLFFSTLRRYRPWKVWATFAVLAIFFNTHLSTWFYVPPLLAYALLMKVRWRSRDLLIGAALGLVVFIPYLYDYIATDFERVKPGSVYRGGGLETIHHNFVRSIMMSTGLGFDFLLGEEGYGAFSDTYHLAWVRYLFLAFALVAGGAFFFYLFRGFVCVLRSYRGKEMHIQDHVTTFFVVAFLLILCVYALMARKAWAHHLVIFYPMFVVFFTLAVHGICNAADSIKVRTGIRFFFALLIAGNLYYMLSFVHFIENDHKAITGDYNAPYRFRKPFWEKQLAKRLEEELPGR